MNKWLKNALIGSISVLSVGVNAEDIASKEYLISQCRSLSQSISFLVERQNKAYCMQQLNLASTLVAGAADYINDDDYQVARNSLDNAESNLQYSASGNCNQYIQIAHAKAEAQRLKGAL